MKDIKYSVLIICYNQEDFITEAIESCLNQTLVPDEIVIADDYSTDGTRKIINNYYISHPTIIKPILNKENLGIYKNYNNAISFLTGEIFLGLGGDDYLLPNAISTIDKLVKDEHINLNITTICIIANHYMLHPNGIKVIWDNYKARKNAPFKEQIRLGLATRDYGISVSTIKQCPIPTDMGISADTLRNLDIAAKTDLFLHSNEVATVHRIGSGITARTKMEEYCASGLLFRDLINKDRYPQIDDADVQFVKLYKTLELMFCSHGIYYLKYYFIYIYRLILNCRNFSPNNSFYRNLRYAIPFYNIISYKIKKMIY
jgi:glycosyltransferase involved in cell wall biosynthesis